MTVAAIVQARLGSTRLPAKVLLPLPTGRTVLEEALYRCKQIPGVDVVVCAIPDTAENDIVAHYAQAECLRVRRGEIDFKEVIETVKPRRRHVVVRGPEHDVLARYAKAAESVNADVILRITSDCPLLDMNVCGDVLKAQKVSGAPFASNSMGHRTFPQGFDCEVFTAAALRQANLEATDASDREHVTPYIWREIAKRDGRNILVTSKEDRSHLRWTLDTKDDYVVIWNEFERRAREAA